ncbi:MAG: histidinol dehydrogenase [Firmicutes bacterium]|nr:histidinol dehydrogenase [Bacillota bacterium]
MNILKYETPECEAFLAKLQARAEGASEQIISAVNEIISDVRKNGDSTLFEYTKKFDGANIDANNFEVTKEEIEEACSKVEPGLLEVLKKAEARIRAYHEKQMEHGYFEQQSGGEFLGRMVRPIKRAGVYVPGGSAVYPSSVLMNIVPAKCAGVPEIIMATPPMADGSVYPPTLAAAYIAGADRIFKMGGAQAIAALAFGTESVPKADKITGPGNIYVAMAKRAVFGFVDIDSVAGPSEVLILADSSARADYAAADLLSQAEHDPIASAILITDSVTLAEQVSREVERQTALLSRKDIIESSLRDFGVIILTENMEKAVELSNRIAPEHLELLTAEPQKTLAGIENAGAVFLGQYTPEPLGDYMAGPNHVLPTGGSARFFSPLSTEDFLKKTSLLQFDAASMGALAKDVIYFAESEQLTAHANAVRIRIKTNQ